MIDQDKRKITFKYGSNSKPTEIIQDGVGSIQVFYDKAGQIKKVDSKGGKQIAIAVAASFQNLLEIIKEEKVDKSPEAMNPILHFKKQPEPEKSPPTPKPTMP